MNPVLDRPGLCREQQLQVRPHARGRAQRDRAGGQEGDRVAGHPPGGQLPEPGHRGRVTAVGHDRCHRPGTEVDRPRIQHAELVPFGIGQHDPGHVPLPDVGRHRAQAEQPFHLGRLVRDRLGGQVQVDPVLDRLGLRHRDEHQRQRHRVRIAVLVRPDVDLLVVLDAYLPAQGGGPEAGQPGGLDRVDDQVHEASGHPDSLPPAPAAGQQILSRSRPGPPPPPRRLRPAARCPPRSAGRPAPAGSPWPRARRCGPRRPRRPG